MVLVVYGYQPNSVRLPGNNVDFIRYSNVIQTQKVSIEVLPTMRDGITQ